MTASGVAAVVVNYNARHHLLECLRSLRSDGVSEVVVVDNASTDGSAEAVADFDPGVTFVQTGANLGFGAAANRGVAATTGDYALILNPDAVVEPGATKVLAEALDRDPGLAVVGPRVENPDGSLYPSARRFPDLAVAAGHAFLGLVKPDNRFTRSYTMLEADRSQPGPGPERPNRVGGPVDWVSGTCMLVRRTAFADLGGFDEAYFMYVEDVDLCWRLGRAGWRIGYEPGARIVHAVGASSEHAPYRMIVAHHRSLLRFAGRTTTGWKRVLLPAVAAGLTLRTGLSCIRRAVTGQVPASR